MIQIIQDFYRNILQKSRTANNYKKYNKDCIPYEGHPRHRKGPKKQTGGCIDPLRKLTGKRKAVGRIFGENALASPTWQEPTGKWTER